MRKRAMHIHTNPRTDACGTRDACISAVNIYFITIEKFRLDDESIDNNDLLAPFGVYRHQTKPDQSDILWNVVNIPWLSNLNTLKTWFCTREIIVMNVTRIIKYKLTTNQLVIFIHEIVWVSEKVHIVQI